MELGEIHTSDGEKYSKLLSRDDLVCQKSERVKDLHLQTKGGEVVEVTKDGCALISLYNTLKLHGGSDSFEEYAEAMADNCLEVGGVINWKRFNDLPYDLKFTWMQDAELPQCEGINTDYLKKWTEVGKENTALVKVQSRYGAERRHFMVALHVEGDKVTCLESSDVSGVPTLRNIPTQEVLGVRYFKMAARDSEENPSTLKL